MSRELLRKALCNAVVRNPVVGTSGRELSWYCDVRRVLLSRSASLWVGREILDALWAGRISSELVCGGGVGGTLLVGADLAAAAHTYGLIIRDEAKGYGLRKQIEGNYLPGQKVLLLDDVLTSGKTLLKMRDILVEAQLVPVHAVVVLDRQEGGKEKVEAAGLRVSSLFTAEELA